MANSKPKLTTKSKLVKARTRKAAINKARTKFTTITGCRWLSSKGKNSKGQKTYRVTYRRKLNTRGWR